MKVVEQEICKRLAEVFQRALPDVSVGGNWLPSGSSAIKGAEPWRGAKLDISVGTRSYDKYTSLTCEMQVDLEGEFPVASDPTLDRSVAAYAAVAAVLDEWHGSISAVKRDLAVEGCFDPVGLQAAGGVFELDRDTKVRHYSQTFALRGRVARTT